jgi:D-aminopeptidase
MPLKRREFLSLPALPVLAGAARAVPETATVRRRARELGIRIGRLTPGTLNAITDVPGVEVGHVTLIQGDGPLRVGEGPVRTGVTAIWPQRNVVEEYLPCGSNVPNGNGEMTGLLAGATLGVISSPLCLTNTSNVGLVFDALQAMQPRDEFPAGVPVVGETWDAFLNDTEGRHVHAEHVRQVLNDARGGPVPEGNVGGGTGMICYGFKGGIGTASRRVRIGTRDLHVGALVQANHGERGLLRIAGVPVGALIQDLKPEPDVATTFNSIIMVLATDAPLLSHDLDRLARRAVHGLARTGSISGNDSGDFAFAFSTANPVPRARFWSGPDRILQYLDQFDMQPLFEAAADAVEESILNALFMATDMLGRDGHRVHALPIERTLAILHEYHAIA